MHCDKCNQDFENKGLYMRHFRNDGCPGKAEVVPDILPKEPVQAEPLPGTVLQISNANDFLVRIKPDGAIEYGKDYTPDKAAQVFWNAIAQRGQYFIPLAVCPPELQVLGRGRTVGLRVLGRISDGGVAIDNVYMIR